MPFCVRSYSVLNRNGEVLWEEKENHQARNEIIFDSAVKTTEIKVRVHEVWGNAPAAIFGVHCYVSL